MESNNEPTLFEYFSGKTFSWSDEDIKDSEDSYLIPWILALFITSAVSGAFIPVYDGLPMESLWFWGLPLWIALSSFHKYVLNSLILSGRLRGEIGDNWSNQGNSETFVRLKDFLLGTGKLQGNLVPFGTVLFWGTLLLVYPFFAAWLYPLLHIRSIPQKFGLFFVSVLVLKTWTWLFFYLFNEKKFLSEAEFKEKRVRAETEATFKEDEQLENRFRELFKNKQP